MVPSRTAAPEVPGLAARRVAIEILESVLRRQGLLDEQLDGPQAHRGRSRPAGAGRPRGEQLDGPQAHRGLSALADRDRALVRKLLGTALRRLGSLRALLAAALDRGLPAGAPRLGAAVADRGRAAPLL